MSDNIDRHCRVRRLFVIGIVGGIFIIILTRLPQLLNPNIVLDGDEAIVGLMAKHIVEGKSLPLFFYGQSYGLSFLEAFFGAIFFGVWGISGLALKTAMLSFWSVGWVFFVLALNRLSGGQMALAAGALLIVCPAWGSWSMMARGHYVSGFVIACLSCWMASFYITSSRYRQVQAWFLGTVASLLYFINQLWFAAFSFFALALLWRKVRKIDLAAILVGFFLMSGMLHVVTLKEGSTYWSPDFFKNPDIMLALFKLPERVFVCLSGAYHYGLSINPGSFTMISAFMWCAILIFCLYRFARLLIFPHPHSAVFTGCFLAMTIILLVSLIINPACFDYRYLIPMTLFLVCFFAVELGSAVAKGGFFRSSALVMMLILVVVGTGSLIEARNNPITKSYPPHILSEKDARKLLIGELDAAGVRYVYCLHPTFQWNIMFLSREKIVARWLDPSDRVPAYPMAVDKALLNGRKVALVGPVFTAKTVREMLFNKQPGSNDIRYVGGRYFWLLNPQIELLISLGFGLNNPQVP